MATLTQQHTELPNTQPDQDATKTAPLSVPDISKLTPEQFGFIVENEPDRILVFRTLSHGELPPEQKASFFEEGLMGISNRLEKRPSVIINGSQQQKEKHAIRLLFGLAKDMPSEMFSQDSMSIKLVVLARLMRSNQQNPQNEYHESVGLSLAKRLTTQIRRLDNAVGDDRAKRNSYINEMLQLRHMVAFNSSQDFEKIQFDLSHIIFDAMEPSLLRAEDPKEALLQFMAEKAETNPLIARALDLISDRGMKVVVIDSPSKTPAMVNHSKNVMLFNRGQLEVQAYIEERPFEEVLLGLVANESWHIVSGPDSYRKLTPTELETTVFETVVDRQGNELTLFEAMLTDRMAEEVASSAAEQILVERLKNPDYQIDRESLNQLAIKMGQEYWNDHLSQTFGVSVSSNMFGIEYIDDASWGSALRRIIPSITDEQISKFADRFEYDGPLSEIYKEEAMKSLNQSNI